MRRQADAHRWTASRHNAPHRREVFMMKRIALALSLAILLASIGLGIAQAVDCTVVYCLYLPVVIKSGSSSPPGVYVLPNHSYFVDSINYLHIVGEVQNNTPNNLRFVKITANLFNSSGQLVANDFTYTWLNVLPANATTCFEILLSQPTGWSTYQFESPTYSASSQGLPNLTVLNTSGSYNQTFGWYEVIGQVRNDNGTRVEYVQPVGTLYNASNTVIGCDFTFVNSTHLDPNQTSSFTMTFTGRNYSDVASFRLQVDGTPQ